MDFQHLPFDKLVELTARATRLTQVLRAEQVAAYTVFIYDWLLTFKTERELLSGSGFTPVKLAYFFCRYWPLVMHPVTIWAQVTVSDFKRCADIFRRPLYLTTFNFVGAALVLLVRLYGFNGGRLLPVFVLAAVMFGVVVFQLYVAATKTMLAPFAPACFPTDKEMGARWLSGYFLAPLLWDMLIMLVFIYTAVRQRLRVSLATGTVRVFVNEGLMYFFAIASVHGVNTILSYQSDIVISGSLVPMSMVLPNLLACRLIINLRRAAAASTRTYETDMEPSYPAPHRGVVHFLPLPLHRANNVDNKLQEKKAAVVPVSELGVSGWFSGSTTFQTTSTGISFVDHSQALALPPPMPTPLPEIRLTDQREFVHVRKNGMWETFNASVNGMDTGSLGVRSDSGTGSFALSFDTTSSFTGTAGARSGTSSFTGTAYRSDDGGQVLLAPPVDSSRRWHWSPRLKLFGRPSPRREPPSTSASSAFPASVHQSSVFTATVSTLSNTSTISPAQRWPADVPTAGYVDVATPVSPLRQRAPVQGVSVVRPRADGAVIARVDRPRLASVAEHETDSRTAMMSIGYSSTFSPRLDVPRSGDRGMHYPFGGFDANGRSG